MHTLIANSFKLNGQPVDATPGQLDIFWAIVCEQWDRVNINCSTQYGKSFIVALACLFLTCVKKRKVVIIAPNEKKAKLIMRYYIEHIGDHRMFYRRLEKNTKLDRLKQEESKERIALNNGGIMQVLSANEKNSTKAIEAAMGEGGDVIILDEAGLLRNETESTIFRMIAGKVTELIKRGLRAKYVKIGNPFYRNHFHTTSKSARYLQIVIDYVQAIREGRYTADYIEEAKERPNFDVLFACLFPDDSAMDSLGYQRLITDAELEAAIVKVPMPFEERKGRPRLSVDVGGGGDSSDFVINWDNYKELVETNKTKDTMAQVSRILWHMQVWNIPAEEVFIDDIAIGRGLTDRMHELGYEVNGTNVANPASDTVYADKTGKELFINVRAEAFWAVRKFIKKGGKLGISAEVLQTTPNAASNWQQLADIRHKADSSGRTKIKSKEEMAAESIKSPNSADAAMLGSIIHYVATADDFDII